MTTRATRNGDDFVLTTQALTNGLPRKLQRKINRTFNLSSKAKIIAAAKASKLRGARAK